LPGVLSLQVTMLQATMLQATIETILRIQLSLTLVALVHQLVEIQQAIARKNQLALATIKIIKQVCANQIQ
jgi:hypothetical protein